MKFKNFAIALTLICVNPAVWARKPTPSPFALLQLYHKDRQAESERFLEEDRASANYKIQSATDETALKKYLTRLTGLLGTPKTRGVKLGNPSLSPTTFQAGPGADCKDAIRYAYADDGLLVVTDLAFYKPGTEAASLLQDKLLHLICDDAAHTTVVTVEKISNGNFDRAFAALAIGAQDIGAVPPNELVVVAQKNTRIYFFHTRIKKPLPQIPLCDGLFHPSGPRPTEDLFNEAVKEETESFKAVVTCYGKNLEKDPRQLEFQKQAIEFVNSIVPKPN